MKNGYIEITLAMASKLDHGKLNDFRVFGDMYEIIPHGYFVIKDGDGHMFSEFNGFAVGTPVDIKITSDDEKETFQYPTFYITQVENNCSADSSTFAGDIKVSFSHPWALLKDVTNHAYEAMNGSDLVKKVLEDEHRGEKFTVNSKNFKKTDDSGKYARYKVNETDYDFLINKVIPYCSIDQNPAHLFCNEKGDWYLNSMRELFKENSKIVIGPKPEDVALKDVGDAIGKLFDSIGIGQKELFNTSMSAVQISDPVINAEIYPSFILENANSGGSAVANKQPGNILKPHSGKSFGNILPIDAQLMSRTTGTKTKTIINRSLVDAFTVMFAGADVLDHMIRVVIETDFVGQFANAGSTVDVVLPKVVYDDSGNKEKGKYDSWISGKWMVVRIEHGVAEGNARQFNSKLYLCRPSFVGNEKTTSILDLSSFYEVQ
jgi:hypothetical protein